MDQWAVAVKKLSTEGIQECVLGELTQCRAVCGGNLTLPTMCENRLLVATTVEGGWPCSANFSVSGPRYYCAL